MDAVQIDCGRGFVAVIDTGDADRVVRHEWRAYRFGEGLYYAQARATSPVLYLHRFILDAPAGMDVDHRDGNGLNNTRANLRIAPHRLNIANQRLSRANTSGFKGVYRHPKARTWIARTKDRGRRVHIGCYATAEEAARAYDRVARELWGEFARTNEALGLLTKA